MRIKKNRVKHILLVEKRGLIIYLAALEKEAIRRVTFTILWVNSADAKLMRHHFVKFVFQGDDVHELSKPISRKQEKIP